MFLGTNCYKPHSFKSTLSSETRLFSCARQELCKLHSFCSTDLADRLDTVCVCIRWAVCVFVSFQTNNKRAFRFKFSPAKQMTVSLQEKKTSKWKKDTGEREEEKKSLTPQFDCCCHGNQADADYYGLHWDVDLKSSCRHDLSIHPSFVSSLKQIEKHDRPVPGPSIGFCLLTEADPRRHVRK